MGITCIVPGCSGAFPLNSETGSADDDDNDDDKICTSGADVCRIFADEPAVVVTNGTELSVIDVHTTAAEETAQKEPVVEDTTLSQSPESDFSGDLEVF
jgi:hypothetical protein